MRPEILATEHYPWPGPPLPLHPEAGLFRAGGNPPAPFFGGREHGRRIKYGSSPGQRARGLVLTRRYGESLFIGTDIEIMVLEARGSRARLAIRAPKECRVLRGELLRPEQQRIKP